MDLGLDKRVVVITGAVPHRESMRPPVCEGRLPGCGLRPQCAATQRSR